MTTAVVERFRAAPGSLLAIGSPLVDVLVDLSSVAEHDCPPVSRFRIALRDRAWLRRIDVADGDEISAGTPLALLSTDPDESLAQPPARALRVSIAAVMLQSHWVDDALS